MKSIIIVEADKGHKLTEFDVLAGLAVKIGTWEGVNCLNTNFTMSFTNLHSEYAHQPEMHCSHADRIEQLKEMRSDCAEAMNCICDQILTLQDFEKMNEKDAKDDNN